MIDRLICAFIGHRKGKYLGSLSPASLPNRKRKCFQYECRRCGSFFWTRK